MKNSKSTYWAQRAKHTLTPIKFYLSELSLLVREDQYQMFKDFAKPDANTRILDVGATSDEILKDSNFFDKRYPYPENLTIATIEDEKYLQKKYPKSKVIKLFPGEPLPIIKNSFDVVVSWATIEHVGNIQKQKFFIDELTRVASKVFITTPYRGCPYEPHTGWFFLHWLPDKYFYKFCKKLRNNFWTEKTLHPLWKKDVVQMIPTSTKSNITVMKMFSLIPSHIIIRLG